MHNEAKNGCHLLIICSFELDETCGPYGHDIRHRSMCAAWKLPPDVTSMSQEEHRQWREVEEQVIYEEMKSN